MLPFNIVSGKPECVTFPDRDVQIGTMMKFFFDFFFLEFHERKTTEYTISNICINSGDT